MSRNCPVCNSNITDYGWLMDFKAPDGWTTPKRIHWLSCADCGMVYGDGDFTQADLDEYYKKFYGYGLDYPENVKRIERDADYISLISLKNARIVDFGGGDSVLLKRLAKHGYTNLHSVNVGDKFPMGCDVIYTSHVLEHIYTLHDTMLLLMACLKDDGVMIIDVPDSTALLHFCGQPMIDFNTKHLNHFTIRTFLDFAHRWGLELHKLTQYTLRGGGAMQGVFVKRGNFARDNHNYIRANMKDMLDNLRKIDYPVNVWGLGDITWHLLANYDLEVVNYIDNDPAMRGQTYKGKPILERPDNDAPIVIMAQGQKSILIENIRNMGIVNEIVEI